MGTCLHTSHNSESRKMKLGDLKLLRKIGRGSFGRVWLVEERRSGRQFALKVMEKARVIAKRSVKAVLTERSILGKLSQQPPDCIVPIEAAFQNTTSLFLLMTYVPGGDLRHYLNHRHRLTLTEPHIKHLVRQLLHALRYLHVRRILHKDLKPENVLIDGEGRPRLADFGIAEYYREENGHSNAGTLGYMAPEVMMSQNHTYTADYYALGVITYELFFARRPYLATTKEELLLEIATKPLQLQHETASSEAMDFIARLLEKKQRLRLGCNGVEEIESHPWLADPSPPQLWPVLRQEELSLHSQEGHQESKSCSSQGGSVIQNLLQRSHIQKMFENYEFSLNWLPTTTQRLDSHTTLKSLIAV